MQKNAKNESCIFPLPLYWHRQLASAILACTIRWVNFFFGGGELASTEGEGAFSGFLVGVFLKWTERVGKNMQVAGVANTTSFMPHKPWNFLGSALLELLSIRIKCTWHCLPLWNIQSNACFHDIAMPWHALHLFCLCCNTTQWKDYNAVECGIGAWPRAPASGRCRDGRDGPGVRGPVGDELFSGGAGPLRAGRCRVREMCVPFPTSPTSAIFYDLGERWIRPAVGQGGLPSWCLAGSIFVCLRYTYTYSRWAYECNNNHNIEY